MYAYKPYQTRTRKEDNSWEELAVLRRKEQHGEGNTTDTITLEDERASENNEFVMAEAIYIDNLETSSVLQESTSDKMNFFNYEENNSHQQEKLKNEFQVYAEHKLELIDRGIDLIPNVKWKPPTKEEKKEAFIKQRDKFLKKMERSEHRFLGTKKYYHLLDRWFPDYELVLKDKVAEIKNAIDILIVNLNEKIIHTIDVLQAIIITADKDIGKARELISIVDRYIDNAYLQKNNAITTLSGIEREVDFFSRYDMLLNIYQELILNLQENIQGTELEKDIFENTITQLSQQQSSLHVFNLKVKNTSDILELIKLRNTEFVTLITSTETLLHYAQNLKRTTVSPDEKAVLTELNISKKISETLNVNLEEITGGVSSVYWEKGIYYNEEVDALYIVATDYSAAVHYTRTIKFDGFWFFVDKETGWTSGIQQRGAVTKYYLLNPLSSTEVSHLLIYAKKYNIPIEYSFSQLLNLNIDNQEFRVLIEKVQDTLFGPQFKQKNNNNYGLYTPQTKLKLQESIIEELKEHKKQDSTLIKQYELPSFLEESDRTFVIGDKGKSIGDVGIVAKDNFKVKYVPKPRITSLGEDGYKFKLAINTRVYVLREYKGWYFISTPDGKSGWVEHYSLAFKPPEPTAELYEVKKGDTLWSVAKKKYRLDNDTDKRLYINAIIYANYLADRQKNITATKKPGFFELGDPYHYNPHLTAGTGIWIPSKEFVQKLEEAGIISNGSLIDAFWSALEKAWDSVVETLKDIWEVIKGIAGFIAGLVWGFIESIIDIFVGIYDVIEGTIELIIDAITGELYKKGKELYHQIKNMTAKDWLDLLSEIGKGIDEWMSDFEKQWNAESVFDRWFFRGRVVGYIIAEIVLAVFTFGGATAAKLITKGLKYLGKAGKVIIEIIETIAKQSKKVKASDIPSTKNKTPDSNKTNFKDFDKKKENSNTSGEIEEIKGGKKGEGWSKELNSPLKPNAKYKIDGYLYETDDLGRVKKVSGELKLEPRSRNSYQQGKSVELKDGTKGVDEGGHIIADRFYGPGEQINYLPQKATLNKGAWKKMENDWAKAIEQGKTVEVDIRPIFKGDSKRPIGFKVKEIINGKSKIREFKN